MSVDSTNKKILLLYSVLLLGLCAHAAGLHFSATNLPSLAGEYNCSYFSTNNVNVEAMLTFVTNSTGLLPSPTGPTWDFSQLQQTNEAILRTDIIAPADGMDGGSFPDASYAEQDSTITVSSTNQTAWRYYSITNQGRFYYGFYVPGTDADGLAVFDPPTLEIPTTVTNGQTWTRTTSWNTTIDGYIPIEYEFSDIATVDAEGTLVLPNLGAMAAWQVHEVQGCTGYLFGSPYENSTNQYYYWLAPSLGVAVQITIYGSITVDGEIVASPMTNSVERMYFSSYNTNTISPPPSPIPQNLLIQVQGGSAVLNWLTFSNSTSYQVLAKGSLVSTNWQLLGLTSGTNWTDTLSPTQRFYRVVGLP